MIVGTIRILPLRNRRADVLEILRSVQGPVVAQAGCLACDIYEEQGFEEAVVLMERFECPEALDEHLRSEAYRRILGAVELSRCRPDIRFETVTASEGIELIERNRLTGSGLPVKGDES